VAIEIERLYREHRAGLIRLVERELPDRYDAEDVVQTAFLDAQRALERGTIPRNPGAWLAAIALNAARRLRRRRRNAELLEEYAVQEASRMPEIRAALTSLPSEQRAAVLYRDVLGFSYGETAEQMGTSVNAVTMLLHRGRRRLREALGVTSGGIGWWRWLKEAGPPQVAVVKGAAAVVVAAGLATGGVVAAEHAARAVAPTVADRAAVLTGAGNLTAGAVPARAGALGQGSNRGHTKAIDGSGKSAAPLSTQGGTGDPTPVSVRGTAAGGTVPSPSTSLLRVPTVPLPAPPIPTLAATVTLATPITTATVIVPTRTTATVTTPLTTVSVPIP